jgi:hypothetical protein
MGKLGREDEAWLVGTRRENKVVPSIAKWSALGSTFKFISFLRDYMLTSTKCG